jgi:hypothetical protein
MLSFDRAMFYRPLLSFFIFWALRRYTGRISIRPYMRTAAVLQGSLNAPCAVVFSWAENFLPLHTRRTSRYAAALRPASA